MSEDFVNSGWKEKKLWTPPEAEDRAVRGGQGQGGGPRSRLRGDGAGTIGQGIAGTFESGKAGEAGKTVGYYPGAGANTVIRGEGRRPGETVIRGPIRSERPEEAAEPPRPPPQAASASKAAEPDAPPPKPPKPPKSPKGPLEALDPDSSSSDDSDGSALPPEYAVLDMNVPRTALVINVSRVLKRLNGCCSLNQLTKNIKSFKENTGVTLEAFLRANPMSFKLEGRIVYLLDRDGEKWKPLNPLQAGDGFDQGKGKGKGKSEVPRGGGAAAAGHRGGEAPKRRGNAGGEVRKQRGGGGGGGYSGGYGSGAGGAGTSWSNNSWQSDWQASSWQGDSRGWNQSSW